MLQRWGMTARKDAIREVLTSGRARKSVKKLPGKIKRPRPAKPKAVGLERKVLLAPVKPIVNQIPAHYQMVVSESPCGHCGFIYFCSDNHECLSCGVKRSQKVKPYRGK